MKTSFSFLRAALLVLPAILHVTTLPAAEVLTSSAGRARLSHRCRPAPRRVSPPATAVRTHSELRPAPVVEPVVDNNPSSGG